MPSKHAAAGGCGPIPQQHAGRLKLPQPNRRGRDAAACAATNAAYHEERKHDQPPGHREQHLVAILRINRLPEPEIDNVSKQGDPKVETPELDGEGRHLEHREACPTHALRVAEFLGHLHGPLTFQFGGGFSSG